MLSSLGSLYVRHAQAISMTNAGCTFELVMLSYKALWPVEAIQSLLDIAPWYVGAWHRGLGTTLSHSIVMKSYLIR